MKLYISEDEIKQALKIPDNIDIRIEGYSYEDEEDELATDEEQESEDDEVDGEDIASDQGGEDTDSGLGTSRVDTDSAGEDVAPTTKKPKGEKQQDRIIRMYLANKDISRKYIAEQIGCSVASVHVTISQYNNGKISGPADYTENKESLETQGDIEEEEPEELSEEDKKERELADKINQMWNVERQSVVEVSQELGISIEECNDIILKYRIKKETFI